MATRIVLAGLLTLASCSRTVPVATPPLLAPTEVEAVLTLLLDTVLDPPVQPRTYFWLEVNDDGIPMLFVQSPNSLQTWLIADTNQGTYAIGQVEELAAGFTAMVVNLTTEQMQVCRGATRANIVAACVGRLNAR